MTCKRKVMAKKSGKAHVVLVAMPLYHQSLTMHSWPTNNKEIGTAGLNAA